MTAMNRRGKLLALSTLTVGLVVLVAAGFAAWSRLEEEWWLYKLNSKDKEERCCAAERLGWLGSAKAVPGLIEAMRRAIAVFTAGKHKYIGPPEGLLGDDGLVVYKALARIGKRALPGLIRSLAEAQQGEAVDGSYLVALAIKEIQGELRDCPQGNLPAPDKGPLTLVNLLYLLAEDGTLNQEVRAAAAEALKKIQGTQGEAQR